MTITVLACKEGGRLYFSGLHQDIMVYRHRTKHVDLLETRGMWIGILDDIGGMVDDQTFSLEKDDTILLYTDGITEGFNQDGMVYGQNRLKKVLGDLFDSSADTIYSTVLQDLENFVGAEDQSDDIAMIVIKRENQI